jgi:hypothetical protein
MTYLTWNNPRNEIQEYLTTANGHPTNMDVCTHMHTYTHYYVN